MKQTAVEWMAAHVNHVIDLHNKKLISEEEFRSLLIEYREQAKAMEKEQSLKMPHYDLDELAKEFAIQQLANPNEYENSVYAATIKNTYMTGFQKALELLTFKSE